jgi:hypothetical protein
MRTSICWFDKEAMTFVDTTFLIFNLFFLQLFSKKKPNSKSGEKAGKAPQSGKRARQTQEKK